MELLLILGFLGLSAGIAGKAKGSSFYLWFLIGFCVPVLGTVAALLYRRERAEPRRRCARCGAVMPMHDQVCMTCGRDLEYPMDALVAD